jgi:hypothetical protein
MALPDGDVPAPPPAMVHVVVDYGALMRGHTVPGERCEIPGTVCRFRHHLKRFCGYTYRVGPGTWQWIPPRDHDVDLTELGKIVTAARRC